MKHRNSAGLQKPLLVKAEIDFFNLLAGGINVKRISVEIFTNGAWEWKSWGAEGATSLLI